MSRYALSQDSPEHVLTSYRDALKWFSAVRSMVDAVEVSFDNPRMVSFGEKLRVSCVDACAWDVDWIYSGQGLSSHSSSTSIERGDHWSSASFDN